MTVATISIPAPQSYKDGRAAAIKEERIKETERMEAARQRREARRREREERIRQIRRQALINICAIVWANIICAIQSIPTLPERVYKGTLDFMAKFIILCLFIGAMLFAFGFFALAAIWLFNMAMPPYWA